MSAQMYEPIRLAPPLEQHERFAWLLAARRLARRALDAALSAPRAASAYVSRLVKSVRYGGALAWLHRTSFRATRPLMSLASRLGRTGVVAGLLVVVASPTGRKVLTKIGSIAVRGLGWLARTVYGGIDSSLRLFGKPGCRAADLLFSALVAACGKVASVAAPVVHKVARVSDPQAPHVRVLAGICRSYFLHRVLKALIGNSLMRLLVEGLLIPTVMDSRIAHWLRRQVQMLRLRAASLQEQQMKVPDLPVDGLDGHAGSSTTSSSGGRSESPTASVDPDGPEELAPSNRAERRAHERHINRQGRKAS